MTSGEIDHDGEKERIVAAFESARADRDETSGGHRALAAAYREAWYTLAAVLVTRPDRSFAGYRLEGDAAAIVTPDGAWTIPGPDTAPTPSTTKGAIER